MTKEKVLIIAVKKQEQLDSHFNYSLDEIISLSHTAGGEVVQVVTQNRDTIHPATYIGVGKMKEIKQLIDDLSIELVVSNDELSAGQLRNLADEFGVRLIDRSQLILDIFAQRAKTKEGQLQVELAQLQYLLPRLHGQGTVLSRLGGGIGTRGPGETQLETDQRHIRRRIDDIKRRLDTVVKQREQYRKRRRENNVYQISVVGYTNAGKSTIFNRLTDSETLEENLLFATLDPLTRKLQLPSGFQCLMTDTVGFLQDLPTTLIASFKSTLEEVTEADLLIHVIDCSHEDQEQHEKTVNELLKELDADQIPMLTVYNKKDLVDGEFFPSTHPSIVMSAYDDADIEQLIHSIETAIKNHWEPFVYSVPVYEGGILQRLLNESIVTKKKYSEADNAYIVSGYIAQDSALNNQLKEQQIK